LEERRRELDTREQELDEHQVRENARLQVAREELERRERELADLQTRLDRREQELNAYVAQLQSGLAGPSR
jgi:chromosome segregation ATPase